MKKTIVLMLAVASVAFAGPAMAQRKYSGPAKTRQEAIQRQEDRLADLKKMTDAEWAQKKQAREQRRAERKARKAGAAQPATATSGGR
jgi:Ni/Co efflux regulator RcnB